MEGLVARQQPILHVSALWEEMTGVDLIPIRHMWNPWVRHKLQRRRAEAVVIAWPVAIDVPTLKGQ